MKCHRFTLEPSRRRQISCWWCWFVYKYPSAGGPALLLPDHDVLYSASRYDSVVSVTEAEQSKCEDVRK